MSTINHFTINVIDNNDNLPVFHPVQSLYSLNEESILGTIVTMVNATDRDDVETGNGRVSYSIPPNNSSFPYQDYLMVHPNGDVVIAHRIDREEQTNFFVLIEAQDNPSKNPLTDIVVVNIELNDINDNAPAIVTPPEVVSIAENQPPSSIVFQVSAYDDDTEPFSTISYSLIQTITLPN